MNITKWLETPISPSVTKIINFIVAVLLLVLFVSAHLYLPLDIIKALADDFSKLAIGLAATYTAFYGSSYLREEFSRKKAIEHFRKKYPHNKYGETFRLIARQSDPGGLYLHDLESLHKHHIWNMKTMYDLGWQSYEVVKLPDHEFLSILLGDPIRTRGELGE